MRSFGWLWSSAALSNLGDGLLVVVLPLAIVHYTRDPLLVAGVAAAAQLPYLLVSLPAGVVADARDRRWLIISFTALAAVILAGVAAATATPARIIALYLGAFCVGACQTVVDTASSALTPLLVPKERLDWANARLYGTESALNEFAGPPLAGLLVTVALGLAFGVTASVYALAAAISWVGLRRIHLPAPSQSGPRGLGAGITEGLRFVWNERVLRTLMMLVAVMAACWSAWEAVLVLYVVRPGPAGLSRVGYGVLLTTVAIGGVLGSVIADRAENLAGRRFVLLTDIVTTAVMIGTPAFTSNPYILGVVIFIGGVGSGMWNVASTSLRQALTPDRLRGRGAAAGLLLGWGPRPLGALLGGVIAHAFTVRLVFAIGGIATVATFIPAARILTKQAVTISGPGGEAGQANSA
jgi:MFS family permease